MSVHRCEGAAATTASGGGVAAGWHALCMEPESRLQSSGVYSNTYSRAPTTVLQKCLLVFQVVFEIVFVRTYVRTRESVQDAQVGRHNGMFR
jgi:hypothetical protein